MTGDLYITCLRTDDGSVKWRYAVPGNTFSKIENLLFDQHQFYGWQDGVHDIVFALNLETGQENWSLDSTGKGVRHGLGPNYYSPYGKTAYKLSLKGAPLDTIRSDKSFDSMSYYAGKVYGCFGWSPENNPHDIGRIICYDEATMDSLWTHEEAGGSLALCYPVYEDGVMYVGTVWGADDCVLALNAETGEVIWENDNYGAYKIIIVGDVLYREVSSAVFAINKTTGENLWRANLSNPDESPTLSYWDGYIYVENYGTLFILNAETGDIVHKAYGGPDGAGIEQVSTGAGKIFIQTSRHLYAFSPYDPEQDTE